MPVVSNTSPILNLAIVDRLFLLCEQFGQVFIPPAVLSELRIEEKLPGSQAVNQAMDAGWIQVVEAKDRALVQLLQRELDKGESEAIALAVQLEAGWTLLDEREGRKVARSLGLRVTGVLGILLRARREDRLPSLREAMDELQELAGFRIGAELYSDLFEDSGEGEER